MPKNFKKTKHGETVGFWRHELLRAESAWDEEGRKETREELRDMTSGGLRFRRLIMSDEAAEEHPELDDQRNFNIILRFVQRLKALAGDESPEIRFPRSMTGLKPSQNQNEPPKEITLSSVGEIMDRFVTRGMEQAGAPAENEDGVGPLCTDGFVVYWWEMTGLPSLEEAVAARKTVRQIVDEAKRGQHTPSRMHEHTELAEALLIASKQNRQQRELELATTAAGEGPAEQVRAAAEEHIESQIEEDKKLNPFWKEEKFRLKCTRLPYGTWFRMDSTVWHRRDVRWMARKIVMYPEEARNFPGFRESVREKLKPKPFDEAAGVPLVKAEDVDSSVDQLEAANGRVEMWHILDRMHKREYMLPDEDCGVSEFLFDRPTMLVNNKMRPTLRAAGSYPGFFPVSTCRGIISTKDGVEKLLGMALALPGLKGQKAVIKLLSFYIRAVKQASPSWTVVNDEDLFNENEAAFRQNLGGVLPGSGGGDKNAKPLIEQFSWKGPGAQLFGMIQDEIERTLQELDFPNTDFTSSSSANTATEAQINARIGSQGAFHVIRQQEMCYAEQAWIALSLMVDNFTPQDMSELIGPVDSKKLIDAWSVIGIPPELPRVKYSAAARSKEAEFARASMLMSLHERSKAEVDVMTGAPALKTDYLLQEGAKTLGVGPLEKFELTAEQNVNLLKATIISLIEGGFAEDPVEAMRVIESGGAQNKLQQAGGKTRDSQGDLRSRNENAGRRDSPSRRGRTTTPGAELSPAQTT